MDKRLFIIAIFVAMVGIVTILMTPSDTTIPLPEPESLLNKTGSNKGIEIIADNLDSPWAIDISKDNRIFFTERDGKIRTIGTNGNILDEPVAFIRVEQKGRFWVIRNCIAS